MKNGSIRQRALVSLTAIALSLGGTLEIASAATASSTRNLGDLTTTELASVNEALDTTTATNDSELVAIKFKKHHGRKFKKHHGRGFQKHDDHKFKKHHGRRFRKHDGHKVKKVYSPFGLIIKEF